MSRYQITLAVICMLAVATGLYAIVRTVLVGADSGVWTLPCFLLCLAFAVLWIIDRRPMMHAAVFRAADFPGWNELSPLQRRCLMLFDWPLFLAIRDREAKRLQDEPLIRVIFEADGVTLHPLEKQHSGRFFLRTIVYAVTLYGLGHISDRGMFYVKRSRVKGVQLLKVDPVIMGHMHQIMQNGDSISTNKLRRAIEYGYILTLPEADRRAYMIAMR